MEEPMDVDVTYNEDFNINTTLETNDFNLNGTFVKSDENLNPNIDQNLPNANLSGTDSKLSSSFVKTESNLNSTFDKKDLNLNTAFNKMDMDISLNCTFENKEPNLNCTFEKKEQNLNCSFDKDSSLESCKDSSDFNNTVIEINDSVDDQFNGNDNIVNATSTEDPEIVLTNYETKNTTDLNLTDEIDSFTEKPVDDQETKLECDDIKVQQKTELKQNEGCTLGLEKTCNLLDISKDETIMEISQEIPTEISHDITTETGHKISTESSHDVQKETIYEVQTETSYEIPTETEHKISTGTSFGIPTETNRDNQTETTHEVQTETGHKISTETSHQISTDSIHEVQTETSYKIPIETNHEIPTDPSHDIPTEPSREIPTESAHKISIETSYEVQTEISYEIPTETGHKIPTETSHEISTDSSHVNSTKSAQENPTQASLEIPIIQNELKSDEDEEIFEDARAPEEEIQQLLDGRRMSLSRHAVEFKLDEQDPKDLLLPDYEEEHKLDGIPEVLSPAKGDALIPEVQSQSIAVDEIKIKADNITSLIQKEKNTDEVLVTETSDNFQLKDRPIIMKNDIAISPDVMIKPLQGEQSIGNVETCMEMKEACLISFKPSEEPLKHDKSLQQGPANLQNRHILDASILDQTTNTNSLIPTPEKIDRMHEPENEELVKEALAPISNNNKMTENNVPGKKEFINLLPNRLQQLQVSERQQKPRPSLLRLFDPLHTEEEAEQTRESIDIDDTLNSTTLPSTGDIINLSFDKGMDAENEEKMNLNQEINRLKLESIQAKQEITKLMLELQKKDEVYIKAEAEWQQKEALLHSENKQLFEKLENINEQNNNEEQLHHVKKDLKECQQELKKLTEENAHYQKIMNEYESTLSAKNCENEKLKMEHTTVTKHLAALEAAFSDVITKYDRCKEIIAGYSRNEETLVKRLEKSNQIAMKYEERYETLKSHANSQLDKANKDLLQTKENHKQEMGKVAALNKRLEIRIASLQQTLDQKNAECAALASLCDEMTGTSPLQ